MVVEIEIDMDAILDDPEEHLDATARRVRTMEGDEIDYSTYSGFAGLTKGYAVTVSGLGNDGHILDTLPLLVKKKSDLPEGKYDKDIHRLGIILTEKYDINKVGFYIQKYTVH